MRRIEAGTLKPSKELANIILEKLGISEMERLQWISFARDLSGFPVPTNSSNKPITNLPAPLTTFIGREKEQSDVVRLLRKHRLITLTGSGGVGKSRLSIKVGEQLLEDYADGVRLVELAAILDPLLVPRITAIAIGLRDEPQRPVIDMLCDYLQKKKMLIILDNCEHLVEACAQLADRILHAAPHVHILASSRELLGVDGEVTYRVPSLEVPDVQDLPPIESLSQYEAVKLFVDRATSANPAFTVTHSNVPALVQISSRLDGIPLAIELAAAKVRMLNVEQIAERLDNAFTLLTGGRRTGLERNKTLHAAIDWSHNLLQPAEQILFRSLSIFVGGWTLQAAEMVCGGELSSSGVRKDNVLSLLEQLINKSLVLVEESHSATRYRMLETIRHYANEKLVEASESELLRDRHLEYFLNLAETAQPHLIRPEQLEWIARLEADYQNIRAALEWALSKASPTSSLRLCAALGSFWSIRSYFLEGSKWLKLALSKPSRNPGITEKAARVRALYQDAELAYQLDDLERAQSSAEASFALAQELADKRDIAIARFYVGLTLNPYNYLEEIRSLLEQSIAEFQELKDPYWEAYTFRHLGYILQYQGKLKFGEWYLQALELARKAGERQNLADALWKYSNLFYNSNRIDDAMKYVEEADILYKQIGSRMNLTSFSFAAVAWLSGDPQEAKSLLLEMQERYGLLGEKHTRSNVTEGLGRIALDEGELEQAYAYFEEALATARELELQFQTASRLALISNIFYLQGNIDKYKQSLKEGVTIAKASSKAQKVYVLLYALISMHLQESVGSAQILGAIDTSERENGSPIIAPLERRYYERAKTYTLEKLGYAAYMSAFAQGQKMSLDEALDLMLRTVDEM